MRRFVLPSLALSALLLGACTQVPQRLRGDFAMLEPVQASAGKFNGVSVRWEESSPGRELSMSDPASRSLRFRSTDGRCDPSA